MNQNASPPHKPLEGEGSEERLQHLHKRFEQVSRGAGLGRKPIGLGQVGALLVLAAIAAAAAFYVLG